MTDTNQTFITYTGDDQRPRFTIYKDVGNTLPLDISGSQEIVFLAQRDATSTPVVIKRLTTNGIVLTTDGEDGQFDVILAPADTAALSGFYFILARIIDAIGEVSTVSTGRWQVGPTPMWTYSGDPANSPRDAVRSYIGDTDYSNQKLMDSQIDQLLRDNSSVLYASAAACQMLSIRYATAVDKRVGDLSISYGAISGRYRDMADDLRRQAALSGGIGTLYTGGVSKSDMASWRNNPDAVGAFTTMTEFDNRGAAGGVAPDNTGDGVE